MKKLVLIMAMSGLTQISFAKNGGSDPTKLAFKNSQAGFVSESLEQSLRMLMMTKAELKDQVENASVVSTTTDDSTVTISMSDSSAITYVCSRIDHLSNGGTVVKKEVICQAQ